MKTKKTAPNAKAIPVKKASAEPIQASFAEVVSLIEQARKRAYQAVNAELVGLYWQIGQYISLKLAAAEWGEGVVDQLAQHLERTLPGLRGFTRRNLFRMRQFFDTYAGEEKVSSLLTQLPWTHNLIILGQSKRPEEREFYLRRSIEERWSSRELERQYRQALFERTVLHPPKVSPAARQMHGAAAGSVLKDAYFVEFLDLPASHSEADLHRGLVARLVAPTRASFLRRARSLRRRVAKLRGMVSRQSSCSTVRSSLTCWNNLSWVYARSRPTRWIMAFSRSSRADFRRNDRPERLAICLPLCWPAAHQLVSGRLSRYTYQIRPSTAFP